MKKKLMDALKTKFSGVDDAILDRIATKRGEAITDEAEIPTIVEGISFQDVLTSYGDFRAGDASVKAVKNYEQKYNLKEGKTNEQEPPAPGPETPPNPKPTDMASQIAALLDTKLNPILEKVSALESEKLNTSLASRLKEKLADVDEDYHAPFTSGRTFKSEEEVDAFATTVIDGWKAFTEKKASEGLSFSPPKKAGTTGDEIDDFVSAIEKGGKD